MYIYYMKKIVPLICITVCTVLPAAAQEGYDYSQNASSSVTTNTTFTVVEQMPEYPGGQDAMIQFIEDNLHYPKQAVKKGVDGSVIVNFIVDKEGHITRAKVLKGIGELCDAEALRMVNSMPDWQPGKQQGVPVNVSINLPINFQLKNKNKMKKK